MLVGSVLTVLTAYNYKYLAALAEGTKFNTGASA